MKIIEIENKWLLYAMPKHHFGGKKKRSPLEVRGERWAQEGSQNIVQNCPQVRAHCRFEAISVDLISILEIIILFRNIRSRGKMLFGKKYCRWNGHQAKMELQM